MPSTILYFQAVCAGMPINTKSKDKKVTLHSIKDYRNTKREVAYTCRYTSGHLIMTGLGIKCIDNLPCFTTFYFYDPSSNLIPIYLCFYTHNILF